MIPDRWQRLERVYHEAADLPVEGRRAFLDHACQGDDALRREIESLLAETLPQSDFLERPAMEVIAGTLAAAMPAPQPPEIPGYHIVRELGQGGMGVVYLAEQDIPLRRLVALKLIRPGMDSAQVIARFDAERQSLALMDHPGIAAVYDAGTTADGRPFFVMEFVDGVPLVEYCDQHQLPTRARLQLLMRICAAVQHAHQKGLIHRDLKPSNVLVVDRDGEAVAKVIDFGTAKATQGVMPQAAVTDHGVMLGTIEYMSPEQAAFSRDIDTTSDVYALGVMLYELLVGALPFERSQPGPAGTDDLRRLIRESEPPRPSTRLAVDQHRGPSARDFRRAVAAARQTDSEALARTIRGDLDWIVLRALEKDRARRYPTVAAFAADIRRYLAHEPVEARPPSAMYRIRKFTWRNRGAVAAGIMVLIVLLAGLAATTAQFLRAERLRSQADRERLAARAAADEATTQRNAAMVATAAAERNREAAEASAHLADLATNDAQYREYIATITAAAGELRGNLGLAARQRLLAVPDRFRHWEWQHLFLWSDASVATIVASSPCAKPGGLSPHVPSDSALVQLNDGARVLLKRCDTVESWDAAGHDTRRSSGPILSLGSRGETLVHERQPDPSPTSRAYELVGRAPGSQQPIARAGPFGWYPPCAALSPDRSRIAVALPGRASPIGEPLDDVFELWDARTGRRLARMLPPKPPLFDTRRLPAGCLITFSADSTKVATSGATVHVWRADSGAEIASDGVQAGTVSQPIAFSPDGTRVAIGRQTGLIDVLQLDGTAEGGAGGTLERFDGGGHLPLLDLPDADRRMLVTNRRRNEVRTITWAPAGDFVVTGTGDRVGIWSVAARRLTTVVSGHAAEVVGVAVTSTGWLLSADVSGEVKAWPSLGGAARRVSRTSFSMPEGLVSASADGSVAAAIQYDAGVMLWRLADPRPVVLRPGSGRIAEGGRFARSLAISSDGGRVLLGEYDDVGTVTTINVEPRTVTQVAMHSAREPGCEKNPKALTQPVYAMAISPDRRSLAFQQSNCIVVRDLASLRTLAVWRENPDDFAFRPDGSLLVASARQEGFPSYEERAKGLDTTRILIWDWRSGRVSAQISPPRRATDRAVARWRVTQSHGGSRIALWAGRSDVSPTVVSIWDGNLSQEIVRLPVPANTTLVTLSADGRRAATGDGDTSVVIWDVDRRQQLLVLEDDDRHTGLAFAGDGRLIAGRASGGLTIWESQRARCVRCPPAILNQSTNRR